MLAAEVGDDVLDGDPTTRRLEDRVADLLGMEAALFFPSGTQANATAVWLLAERGTEVVVEAHAHLVDYELGGLAALSGVQYRPVPTPDGVLTRELVQQAWRVPSRFVPRASLLAAENTHTWGGGKVMSVKVWDGLVEEARARRVGLHLDGARLWHAAVALDVPPARLARGADTVMVSFSKGLGCPIGSCLAGSRELIARAWEVRKRLGGGMRQTGILAAAALFALDHNVDRLEEDHAKARMLAERLSDRSGVAVQPPETNIAIVELHGAHRAGDVVAALERRGVRVVALGDRRLRAVLHLDVDSASVARAAEAIAAALRA